MPTRPKPMPAAFRELGNDLTLSRGRPRGDGMKMNELTPELARMAFHAGAQPAWLVDLASRRVVDCTDAAVTRFGYSREEFQAAPLTDFVHQDDLPPVGEVFPAGPSRWRHRSRNSALVECEVTARPLPGGLVLITAGEAVEQRRTLKNLREREELLRSILATIPAGVFWKDRASIYLGCNEQYAATMNFGSPGEVIGRTDFELFANAEDADAERLSDRLALESDTPLPPYEVVQTDSRGRRTIYLMSKVVRRNAGGSAIGIIGVQQDITEKKQLEEQYLQSQKMEVLGRLCGGVAHDFNNLLTIILGNADLLSQIPPSNPDYDALTTDIRDAGTRATALTRQLLTFSRKQPFRAESIDLNEVSRGLVGLLRRLLGERVNIETDLADAPATVQADRGQFEQILMNLAVNARDAMPKGGSLFISTAVLRHSRHARTVRFSIRDTGTGMTDEVRSRIFEPFYSTKGTGRGTGLGLATVWRIVNQAGGNIVVNSAPGAGTEFVIDLPWSDHSPSRVSLGATPMPPKTSLLPVNKSILLVEDEASARKMARHALTAQGYRVTDFGDAESAQRHVETGANFDILITDLILPGMDGRDLADRVRERSPKCGIVFISGYAPDQVRLERLADIQFLPKPFGPSDLVRAVGRLLNRTARGSSACTPVTTTGS